MTSTQLLDQSVNGVTLGVLYVPVAPALKSTAALRANTGMMQRCVPV